MDQHTQYEIRAYAEQLLEVARVVCPIACEAFEEHISGSIRFSRSEVDAIRRLLRGENEGLSGKELERFTNKLQNGHE